MTLHKSHEQRRSDILAAALKRFVTDGYARARLNDVAADAGLSKGGVYFHFKSKREIFDALVEQDFERAMQAVNVLKSMRGPVSTRLVFFARAGVAHAVANPDSAKFSVVLGEMAISDDEVQRHLATLHERFVSEVRGLLETGIAEGDIDPTIDLDAAARLLKSVMDGLRIAVAAGFTDGTNVDATITGGAQILMTGLAARPAAAVAAATA